MVAMKVPVPVTGMKVSARGTKVAGAPIGDDDFCAKFVQLKVQEATALEGIHPQVGMLLLRLCCMPLLNYLAQVVPPSLVAEHFDAQIADFVLLLLLTLPGRARSLPCAGDRMRAFRRRLRLPMRHNGAGLIGVENSVRPDVTILYPASQDTVWFDRAGTHSGPTPHASPTL
jgi:hypothetical protein